MRPRLLVLLIGAAACEPKPPQPAFEPMSDVKTLMAAVVEPAAEVYWDAVGSWDDSTGTHVMVPTTDSAWTAVQAAAITVGESGNLLMIPPRAVDQGEWATLSRAMTAASREALAAAIARDTTRVFNAGATLYDACTACHAKYATQVLRPNAR
jgi:hypothetical protein